MSDPELQRRGGGGWILPVLLVAMVALPFLEIYLIVQVGQLIGVWWTLAILVGEALLGAWLMRREGTRAWKELNETFAAGKRSGAGVDLGVRDGADIVGRRQVVGSRLAGVLRGPVERVEPPLRAAPRRIVVRGKQLRIPGRRRVSGGADGSVDD
jgi:hypothetical protein